MSGYLIWDADRRSEVSTVEEMDLILDRLTSEAKRVGMPIGVQLELGSGSAMTIGVGGEESHVEFLSPSDGPMVVGCRGPWQGKEGDEIVRFSFGGEYSEIQKRYTVPIAQAREALREFMRTNLRPNSIPWG